MNAFDSPINRHDTSSLKYDKYEKGILPAWVADMDFYSPKCVIESLEKRVEHGVFGYTNISNSLKETTKNFIKRHYGWDIKTSWLLFTSGVVSSMNIALTMLDKSDSIITTNPIYPYFFTLPKSLGIETILVPMRDVDKRWSVDFDEFERAIRPNTKMMLLCNPYNPGGTVFTKEELLKFAKIALKHDLLIVSDEIHADLILNDKAKHIPIASLGKEIASRTISLYAPSKTFNIAGLQSSYAVISDLSLKDRFIKAMGHLNGGVNLFGLCALEAAYEDGDEWLFELRKYLASNLEMVQNFVLEHEGLKLLNQDATYLAWIDVKSLHVKAYELFLSHKVALSDGKGFGGDGFVRLNFGTPKILLNEILERMDKALKEV